MSRVKRPAEQVRAPRDAGDANQFVAAIGAAQRELTVIQAALEETIAAARASAEEAAKPHAERVDRLTRGLQLWAEANRPALTQDGRSKTVKLAAGEIAWRQLPPSVTIKGVPAVLAALIKLGLRRFVREKLEIDKEAMLKEPDVAVTVPGVSIGSKGEEFVVTPVAVALSEGRAA